MYASTPPSATPPHAATTRGYVRRLDLSDWAYQAFPWRASNADETAEDVFRDHISPIVQAKCINCHVADGPSGNTRLVFVPVANVDHLALNLAQFEGFLDAVDGGADVILNKIRGVGHGGGVQVPAGGEEYLSMERFLILLGGTSSSVLITPATLFDGLETVPERKTLRRAAIVFAGRVPTEAEYDRLDEVGIRQAIRSLMTGEAFHNFLIRSSNDRLLTDREDVVLSNAQGAPLVTYVNEWVHRCQVARANNDFNANDNEWVRRAQYGARQAPLELIAHVVENDLPYTEILTADYIMANPWSARAYGNAAAFEDPGDVHEFQPMPIARYYLLDDTRAFLRDPGCGSYIVDPGELALDFPHAGILNTMVYLRRYPTTATNRNRARSRWTYYHFLGVDIEKSASRTTDPVALADTDNPTLKNPACTACHIALDPVAGVFQNYSDIGHYRANAGGMDSLDPFYKLDPIGGEDFVLEATSFADRERVVVEGELGAGSNAIGLKAVGRSGGVAVDSVTIHDAGGRLVASFGPSDFAERGACGSFNYAGVFAIPRSCVLIVDVDATRAGLHRVTVEAWDSDPWDEQPALLRAWVPGYFYRDGDTWYRDMRAPGFGAALAPDADTSAQWLAQAIVADDRFAEAAVKFWWPAILGDDVASPPELADDADFDGQLLRASAQQLEVERLAALFRAGIDGGAPYNLKDLLVEIVLSKWFTVAEASSDDALRFVALRGAGGGRLLTGEELAAKTLALTGVQWGRLKPSTTFSFRNSAFTTEKHALSTDYAILYGGIDSDGVTERARDITSVMVGVAKRHAVKVSCPVVLREFYLLPDDERLLFAGIEATDSPADADGAAAIRAKLAELHERLLGVTVEPSSAEVSRAYDFFAGVWNRKRESAEPDDDRFIGGQEDLACDLATDEYYFESLPLDALAVSDLADPEHVARTWVVMLAALLMDHRYLHL